MQQCGGYDGSLNHPTGGYLLQFQPTAGATPPKRPGGPWNARPQTGNPRWDQGLWRKEMGCVLTRGHTTGDKLGANWEREPSLTRRPAPSACRTAGSSVAARTPSSSLMAIRGQRATTGLINQTRPSRRLKATFRDGHHILWCRAVLILTRNLGGSNAKTVSFWICRRSNRVGHDCLGRSQYRHTPSRPCSAKGGAGAVRTHPGPTLPGITPGLLIGLSGMKLPS